ncbi:MAG: hypothetical protein JWO53_208 [Chlamydiia bacterium]|nr:hypothetical protein [Chlamydiia bacterium]
MSIGVSGSGSAVHFGFEDYDYVLVDKDGANSDEKTIQIDLEEMDEEEGFVSVTDNFGIPPADTKTKQAAQKALSNGNICEPLPVTENFGILDAEKKATQGTQRVMNTISTLPAAQVMGTISSIPIAEAVVSVRKSSKRKLQKDDPIKRLLGNAIDFIENSPRRVQRSISPADLLS